MRANASETSYFASIVVHFEYSRRMCILLDLSGCSTMQNCTKLTRLHSPDLYVHPVVQIARKHGGSVSRVRQGCGRVMAGSGL